jgi:hypothetical protein
MNDPEDLSQQLPAAWKKRFSGMTWRLCALECVHAKYLHIDDMTTEDIYMFFGWMDERCTSDRAG